MGDPKAGIKISSDDIRSTSCLKKCLTVRYSFFFALSRKSIFNNVL